MKLKGVVKEDLYYIEEAAASHLRELIPKKDLEEVLFKYASGGAKGVYDTEDETFTTENGEEFCIPLEHITII